MDSFLYQVVFNGIGVLIGKRHSHDAVGTGLACFFDDARDKIKIRNADAQIVCHGVRYNLPAIRIIIRGHIEVCRLQIILSDPKSLDGIGNLVHDQVIVTAGLLGIAGRAFHANGDVGCIRGDLLFCVSRHIND